MRLRWALAGPIWTIFGEWGLVGARVLLAFAIFVVALGRKMAIPAALAGAMALWISRPFLDVRPILVTLFVLASMQRWLEADRACAKRRTFFLAIVAQIALANTQGLFLLGPILVGVFSIDSFLNKRQIEARRLGMLALAMIAASLVNPLGWHAFALAGKVAGRIAPTAANLFSSEIPENAPLWTEAVRSPSTIFLLVWLVATVCLFWKRDAHSRTRLFLLMGTGLLSAAAIRNLPLLCLQVAFCLDFSVRPALVKIWSWSAALMVLALVGVSIQERRWNLPSDPVAPLRLPSTEALEIIHRDPAPVFHEIRAGGWLSWNVPSRGLCWADIREPTSLAAAFEGATRVVHLAALIVARRDPERLQEINVEGTRNVLREAKSAGVSKFVHISSISVHYRQQNPYSRSKRVAEDLVRASDLNWTILRPTLAWGDAAAMEYATFARTVARWPLLPLPDGGNAIKSPVHVDDLALAFATALSPSLASRMEVDLPGPDTLSLREMASLIRMARGTLGRTLPVPGRLAAWMVRSHAALWRGLGLEPLADWQTWTGLSQDAAPDITSARQILAWDPRPFCPTADGLSP